MAETKQSTQAAVKAAAPSAPPLARAGESGDPAVHQLLAERQTALINGDAVAIAEVDRRLAELGYGA
jgi:hypothetical protein